MNFWQDLKKPIIGLAPMDAITDQAYREVQSLAAKPDVIFTEFIPVEGIVRLQEQLLRDFWYSQRQRPVVAQIYGNEPELFYAAAQLACELGFDGVDINMGCPAKSVVHRGCGAALIRTPDLALELITAVQNGVRDWQESGINWNKWPILTPRQAKRKFSEFLAWSKEFGVDYIELKKTKLFPEEIIPVSVKTRIGFEKPVVSEWIPTLLSANLAAITLHGRTLKQLYTGKADWDEITRAVGIRDGLISDPSLRPLILGNGDIDSREQARQRIETTGVDGVLIGRGSFGNPWIFDAGSDVAAEPSLGEKFKWMLKHCELHFHYKPGNFVNMRKILAWYIKAIPGAGQLRSELVRVNSIEEVSAIAERYI